MGAILSLFLNPGGKREVLGYFFYRDGDDDKHLCSS